MQKIRIDFDNPGLPQHISAVENDSQSRFFEAALYENGKAYTAPEGATYSIMYRGFGPQNQGWYDTINDGAGKRAACAVSGNVVTCEIARQALQVPGHVSIVLCVTTGKGYMLKSWPIECDCKNDRYDSTVEIQSFFYVTQISNESWTQAIQAVEDLKNTIDPTLSLSGKAADAAKVGEAVNAEAERAKGVESQIKEDLGDIWVDKTVNIKSDGKTYFFKFDVKSGETFIIQNNTDGWANISTKEQPLTSAPDVQLLANMKPNSTTEVVISDSAPYIRFYSSKAGVIYLKKKNTIVERIQTDINKLKEQKTFICAKDGSGDFTKIVDAVNYINDNSVIDATLYIRDGTWDICSEYGAEMETMNSKKRGLYLKNRIHIICSSRAVITAKYTGTNDTVREWFSAFNAGENGFILENAKIETDNIRYCVHDERDAGSDCYKNQYINCDMTHTNGFYVQCIGGGLGLDGHIIIDGCKFKGKVFGSQDMPLVSYHNSADGAWDDTKSKGAKSFIDIKGCYLADKGTFNFINFGKSDKLTTVLLHDNSIGGAIQISNGSKFYQQNIEILEWNNMNRNTN